MDFYYIKCSRLIKSNNFKIKRKNSLYSRCICCGFKKSDIIDEVELVVLSSCRKITKIRNLQKSINEKLYFTEVCNVR